MKHPLFQSAHGAEDVARLTTKVERRAAGVDAEGGRAIIDDAQLENPGHEELGCIYLTATITSDGRDLLFIAERVIFSPSKGENLPLGAESFRANSFSEWLARKRSAGWRFCG